ncbi:MAG: methyltransferase domain-containing protein [Verrucomicrobiota bacterium]
MNRYAEAAKEREQALCCPVNYDPKYLEIIPEEVIAKDYGCGDPSRYVQPGETVLDLGSGAGKICFIASQVVGPEGRVIGVDMTDDMLEVANRNAPVIAEKLGYANVEFRKGRIQDLKLDLKTLDQELKERPITSLSQYEALNEVAESIRTKQPLIEDDSVDVVVSNCVLNLVEGREKRQLFEEIFRVLKLGGRAVISDIVADEPVPEEMQQDPDLWSGCISGAMTEEDFIQAFEDAGFYGIEILKLDQEPWRTVQGIEFRSMTLRAFKGKQGECWDCNQAVIYKGPFSEVYDDDNHCYLRGVRQAVCDKTFQLLQQSPYAGNFEFIEPRQIIDPQVAKPFDSAPDQRRDPRETKGRDYQATNDASSCCEGGGGSCC